MYENEPRKYVFELIAGIQVRVRRLLQDSLATLGLTYPQYGALAVLERTPGISQQELATALQTDTTNVMVICDGLEKKGLVSRGRDPEDRRRHLLNPSELALATVAEAHGLVDGLLAEVGADIPTDETRAAIATLEKLFRSVSAVGETPRPDADSVAG